MPAAAAYGSRRARREQRAANGPDRDRLAGLATWWAGVAGTAPPRRVEQLWLSRPSAVGPAKAEVVIRRFDAPTSVEDAIGWAISAADDAVDDGDLSERFSSHDSTVAPADPDAHGADVPVAGAGFEPAVSGS